MSTELDDLPDAVMVLDSNRLITYVNRAAVALAATPEAGLVGRSCDELLVWHDSRAERGRPDRWPSPARLRGTRTIKPQPGAVLTAQSDAVAVTIAGTYRRDAHGQLTGAVLTLRPPPRATPRTAAGMEVVSIVSHELRSPLTSIKGYTNLMLGRWKHLSDDQKKVMLEEVRHDADRVARLLTELLDISRLDTGRLTLRRQMVDLPRLAANVVEKLQMEYPELEATCWFPDPFPKVYADPDKIEQVLTNLVENACKYACPTGLRIDGTHGLDTVSVAVRDRGEGIAASDLPKVFTKFFRRDMARPSGSGLGLWISRGLVEAHGGDLRAESIKGQGSTFRFTLPVLDPDQPQEQQ